MLICHVLSSVRCRRRATWNHRIWIGLVFFPCEARLYSRALSEAHSEWVRISSTRCVLTGIIRPSQTAPCRRPPRLSFFLRFFHRGRVSCCCHAQWWNTASVWTINKSFLETMEIKRAELSVPWGQIRWRTDGLQQYAYQVYYFGHIHDSDRSSARSCSRFEL